MTRFGWRAWIGVAAIFLLGIVAGSSAMLLIGGHVLRQRLTAPGDVRTAAERTAARIGADLTTSLDLPPEQAARIQELLDQSAGHLKAIRLRALAEARDEVRASTQRIAAELSPPQQEEFFRLIARRFERLGLPPPHPSSTNSP